MGRGLDWVVKGVLGLVLLTPAGCKSTPENLYALFLSQKPGISHTTNPYKKRQQLLEEIIEQKEIPYVADIIYYNKNFKKRYQKAMQEAYGFKPEETENLWTGIGTRTPSHDAVTISPREQTGKGKDSVIIAFPILFQYSKKLEDLLSCIIDHEAIHAKDNAKGIKIHGVKADHNKIKEIGPGVYQDVLEIFAYSNQLEKINSGARPVSALYKKRIEQAYARTYNRLMKDALNGNGFALSAFAQAPYAVFLNLNTQEVTLVKKSKLRLTGH